MDERIQKIIDDFISSYFKDNNICENEEGAEINSFGVGPSDVFYTISYENEVVGSVLKYRNDIIVSTYYTEKKMQVLN